MAKKFHELRSKMTRENQEKAVALAEEMVREMPLHELRAARRLSQETLAEVLKTRQSSISKIERRADMYVSTLRRYIEAMGGHLEITAQFPDGTVRITQFEDIDASPRQKLLRTVTRPVNARRRTSSRSDRPAGAGERARPQARPRADARANA